MKAVVWHGTKDVRVENVDDPAIVNASDAIVRIAATAICGSDLHIYDGYIPTMEKGDILGHEFAGEIVDVGPAVKTLKRGDRVVVPFSINCGGCSHCNSGDGSFCDNSNPNGWMAEKMYGYSPAGLYGYSHLYGGYSGGQAEYARVPFADANVLQIPESLSYEKVLFLSDIFPTGYMAAENCAIEPGDMVAVWGCGPVGQFAIRSALLLGAGQVVAIDRIAERLDMARAGGARTLDFDRVNILDALHELSAGRGPDACIDCVGMESHGAAPDALIDSAKQRVKLVTDRIHALRQAIQACGKGGTVSIPGVYGGFVDSFPIGAAFSKGLRLRMGQTHVQRYMKPLLDRIQRAEIDPSFVITHRIGLGQAPDGYAAFRTKSESCIKVVMDPAAA